MSAAPAESDQQQDGDIAGRLGGYDWAAMADSLDAVGYAVLPRLLDSRACAAVAGLYDDDRRFRSRVVMRRHGFGSGEYKYFAAPLPTLVAALRAAAYSRLAPIADRWAASLDRTDSPGQHFPPDLVGFLDRCAAAGQAKPTPLLLRYGPGDFNCLHQDLYGAVSFPLQLAVLLSAPGNEFAGGEFLLVEQRPRAQSRAEVIPLDQGDAVVFAVRHRPVRGARGTHRVTMRHGVSRVRSGERFTLGVIFHDAA
ncbi:MAG: 2OG-Fe(II) oxygenase [Alphaproteobacteria bacterium]|nr:2OG-Fe(II) oxygenase [Alphaproteobacteria bacterium]